MRFLYRAIFGKQFILQIQTSQYCLTPRTMSEKGLSIDCKVYTLLTLCSVTMPDNVVTQCTQCNLTPPPVLLCLVALISYFYYFNSDSGAELLEPIDDHYGG